MTGLDLLELAACSVALAAVWGAIARMTARRGLLPADEVVPRAVALGLGTFIGAVASVVLGLGGR